MKKARATHFTFSRCCG